MTVSRRVFVKSGSLALLGLARDVGPLAGARAARGASPRSPARALVCLFLRGGVDGLSVVVPHGDPVYYRERPRIAVPRSAVIDLDGYFGLHPGLAPLKPLWDAQVLAAIHAVGWPQPISSHAGAQRALESGMLGAARGAPWRAGAGPHPPDDGAPGGSAGVAYPPGEAGQALRRIARLIKAGVGLEIACAAVTGWDTHLAQGAAAGPLAARLAELGQALAAFARDLGPRLEDVVVLTLSEFGRSVPENAYGGTDHGHATALLVLGASVEGGRVLGRWPGLDPARRSAGRGLAATTDVRDVVAEIVTRHLGARAAAAAFPAFTADPRRFPGAVRT
jgi:uncharacterized protein (DUF1501 family)